MGTKKTSELLKECMSDALIRLMGERDYESITVNEIAETAGVNRSTWFRNFTGKSEALTFKLVQLWKRFASEHGMKEHHRFTVENAVEFFRYNYENRNLIKRIFDADMQSAVYDAFSRVIMSQFAPNTRENYQNRFLSYGLFGLLTEWVKRGFRETPEEMVSLFNGMMN